MAISLISPLDEADDKASVSTAPHRMLTNVCGVVEMLREDKGMDLEVE